MTIRDKTAIAGLGSTPYYKRGTSLPQTLPELVCKAIIAAVDDAGLTVKDIDGFAYYSEGFDTPYLMETLGIPEIRYTATLTGSGGGSAGAVGLAASAIVSGMAETVVVVGGTQMAEQRFGSLMSAYPQTPENAFFSSAGLVGPGHMFALLARRHMHLYGTTREHFAEVAISTRLNAMRNPGAVMRKPMSRDDYFNAPMIADPCCLFDFCLETDGAIAVVVTSTERARDLRRDPVRILASTHGGGRDWGRALYWMNMPDEAFASGGHAPVARGLYAQAGVTPGDIDCAQIYDHFSPMVITQLEDYGFCGKGEGGPFVASGAIRYDGGSLPVNTDGGQLSAGYIWGMSHVREGVEQLRGTAVSQVADAELVLVTGGPSSLPVSGLILAK
ncbi:thiolase C-terminal domain-containing protein [Rhodoligotrophos appendicifer]|uniref:thiolase C-terminal domain-containing protein n=2 Tax=Rhodoligotrophos appendicifer TaxID=987056 RepID=UPI001186B6C2|nr:thiolase [Rhodoligotrophos appendicifer]